MLGLEVWGEAMLAQGFRADRSDRCDQHARQRRAQARRLVAGYLEDVVNLRRAREQRDVDGALTDGVDTGAQWPEVERQGPAIDGDANHLGTAHGQAVE